MLSKAITYTIDQDGSARNIVITPLFLRNTHESWQPNEIYELSDLVTTDDPVEITEVPVLGYIIIDEHKEWRLDGESGLDDAIIEQIAHFVLNYQE